MNPEFQRQIWTHFRPTQAGLLLAGTIIIGLITSNIPTGASFISSAGVQILLTMVTVVGAIVVGQSITRELLQNTWDQQRMSGLTAIDLVWGKWLGASALIWVCFGAAVLSWPVELLSRPNLLIRLVVGGLTVQALALMLTLVFIRIDPKTGRGFAGVAIIASALLGSSTVGTSDIPLSATWGLVLVLGLVLLGTVRLMRLQLQQRNLPWAWLLALAVVVAEPSLIVSAFAPERLDLDLNAYHQYGALVTGYSFGILLTVAALWTEPKLAVDLRRLVAAVRAGQFVRAAALLPVWVTALLVLVPTALWIGLQVSDLPRLPLSGLGIGSAGGGSAGLAVFALLAFVVRDALFLHWVNYLAGPKRGFVFGLLALAALYAIPLLLSIQMRSPELFSAFFPSPLSTFGRGEDLSLIALVSALVQAVLYGALAWRVARRVIASPNEGDTTRPVPAAAPAA